MVFKKQNIDELDAAQMKQFQAQADFQEDQSEDEQFMQPEGDPSLGDYNVSDKIISPQARFVPESLSKTMMEPFTRDMTTGFCDDMDRSVADQLLNLTAQTDDLHIKYYVTQKRANWDLTGAHNMHVKNILKMPNTSKMMGRGSKTAKSMYTESSGYLRKEVSRPKKKGMFG